MLLSRFSKPVQTSPTPLPSSGVMSSFNDEHMTWTTAYDLINREIIRLQSMSTTREQQRYGEAVLLKEVAFLSAMMVKTVRKILTYLKRVEHMDLGR